MSVETLFELLPAVHRQRDRESQRVLETLLAIVQGEVDRVSDDVEDLYDDWFIETCRDWVVPYLGELVSARGHYAFGDGALSLRAFVANTLNFRRRKGTASMLEDLCLAVTGWPCRALEMFPRVATTQNVNHPRPSAAVTLRVRDAAALECLTGPFDTSSRTVDVRRIALGTVRHNVANVALFLYRLQALEAVEAKATPATAAGPGRFRFDPLGVDRELFGPARTLGELSVDVEEPDAPAPLRRRALFNELARARRAIAEGGSPSYRHFEAGAEALTLTVVGEPLPIPREQLQICNLDEWATTLPAPLSVTRPDGSSFSTRVAVDPKTGRIAFFGTSPSAVKVTYHYPSLSHVGATHAPRDLGASPDVSLAVADWTLAAAPELADALTAWATDGRPSRVIEIADSGRYAAPAALNVPAGCRLVLRARAGMRPSVALAAAWSLTLEAGATLEVQGFMFEGAALEVTTQAGAAARAVLELDQVTLVPGATRTDSGACANPGAVMLRSGTGSSAALRVRVRHSILGALDLTAGTSGYDSELELADSVIDAGWDGDGTGDAIRAQALSLSRCTLLGDAAARTLEATDTLFCGTLAVERTQVGCVRYSYLLPESKAPRTYRCQPALALSAAGADPSLVLARLEPAFTSLRFGDPGYVQLAQRCPHELSEGGSDGGEMGVYFELHQPQREANLRRGLDEYLRFGLEAGLIYVT